ncbi:MAG: hypothetical protein LBP67_08650 [Bacteroidales bacterium]|jgi:hypothetical protein|nr:hypothetical protein [Bacteroidales bacterium]
MKTLRNIQIFWSLFIGIGALWGSLMMFIDPTGKMFYMDELLPFMQVLPFPEIFFRNMIFPGICLLIVNGISNFIALFLLFRRRKYGSLAGMICGIVLMLWIIIQFFVFPFNWLSTSYFVFGLLQALNGFLLIRKEKINSQIHT